MLRPAPAFRRRAPPGFPSLRHNSPPPGFRCSGFAFPPPITIIPLPLTIPPPPIGNLSPRRSGHFRLYHFHLISAGITFNFHRFHFNSDHFRFLRCPVLFHNLFRYPLPPVRRSSYRYSRQAPLFASGPGSVSLLAILVLFAFSPLYWLHFRIFRLYSFICSRRSIPPGTQSGNFDNEFWAVLLPGRAAPGVVPGLGRAGQLSGPLRDSRRAFSGFRLARRLRIFMFDSHAVCRFRAGAGYNAGLPFAFICQFSIPIFRAGPTGPGRSGNWAGGRAGPRGAGIAAPPALPLFIATRPYFIYLQRRFISAPAAGTDRWPPFPPALRYAASAAAPGFRLLRAGLSLFLPTNNIIIN